MLGDIRIMPTPAARLIVVLTAAAGLSVSVRAQDQSLATALQRAGAYVTAYERQMSMVVSEEAYMQTAGAERRILKSDLLVVDLGVAGWFGFRDVFEVDGIAVRGHDNRLLALVTSPVPDAVGQAKRMAEEGARFNIGGVVRTINAPTIALMFLRSSEQPRSQWSLAGRRRISGHEVLELRFVERDRPRAIETRDDAPAQGSFWIEPDSGRLVRSQLIVASAGMTATVTVTFGPVPNIGPWVPLSMDDEYRPTNRSGGGAGALLSSRDGVTSSTSQAVIEGHATYRNFRTFTVETNTVIRR